MPINFDDLKIGLDMFKTAIGIAKDAKDLLPDGEQKKTLVSSLDTAERTTGIAEAQIAKGLGYDLCKCTFPPQIMLSIGYQGSIERYQCPNCKQIIPNLQPIDVHSSFDPDSWMSR